NYAEIKFFVDELKIPVIGNGDIACLASLKKMLATGCTGVMLARAGVGQPWLIQKLIAEMQQQDFICPTHAEIGFIFIEHIEQLIMLLHNEKSAILQLLRLAKYYARPLSHKIDFCAAINVCNHLDDLRAIVTRYF